jgi:hypothetical protein
MYTFIKNHHAIPWRDLISVSVVVGGDDTTGSLRQGSIMNVIDL